MHKFHIKVSGKPLCECTANGVWDKVSEHLRELRRTKAPGHTIAMSCAFSHESDAITLACIIKELFPGRKVESATGGCPLYGADAIDHLADEPDKFDMAVTLAHSMAEAADIRGMPSSEDQKAIAGFMKIHDDIPPVSNVTPLFFDELNKDSDKVMSTLLPDHLVNRRNPDVTPTLEDAIDYINMVDGQLHEAEDQFERQASMFNSALMLIRNRAKQDDGGMERAWLKQQEHINGLSREVTETETGKPTDTK